MSEEDPAAKDAAEIHAMVDLERPQFSLLGMVPLTFQHVEFSIVNDPTDFSPDPTVIAVPKALSQFAQLLKEQRLMDPEAPGLTPEQIAYRKTECRIIGAKMRLAWEEVYGSPSTDDEEDNDDAF
jgi:hypothetical protein